MVRGRDKFTNGMGYAAVHLVNNDYWEKGKTVQGHWWGKACQRYGVEHGALVDTGKEFGALSSNKHPITGQQITKHLKERKPFCDITSGAPKTFSVGAVIGRTLGEEKADLIRGWHRSADEKQRIELEAITGRQANVKGGDHVELTCNLCAAVYEHDTNRCLEAHLHTHSVIQNMTQASNGKDYAIEFREYLDQSNYLTAIYRDSLGADALDHGVELQWDEHGAPQIVELLDMKEASEQRTREIESLVEQIEEVAGTKLSSGEAKVITLASRGLDLEKFKVIWAKEKDELDALKTLDPEKAIQSRWVQLTKFANIVTRSSQKDLFHITAKEVADKQLAIYTPEQQHKLCKWLSGIELVRRPDRSKEISQDVEFAIRHMFERKSVIKTHELYTEILNHARGQRVDLAHMKSMVAAHPELVQGRGGNVTTLTHLRREVESLLWIEEGKEKGIALEHRANDRLTAHQNEAVKSLLECQDQFSALGVSCRHGLHRQ